MKANDYRSLRKRMFYNSPLYIWWGNVLLLAVLLHTFYLAGMVWPGCLTPLQSGWLILYGMIIAFLGHWLVSPSRVTWIGATSPGCGQATLDKPIE